MEQELATSAEDEADAAECLRRSLVDSDAGRVRLFSTVAAEWRTRYNLPVHLSDEELFADGSYNVKLGCSAAEGA